MIRSFVCKSAMKMGEVTIQEKLPLSLLQPGAIKSKALSSTARINGKLMTADLVKELLNKEVTVEMKVVATGETKKGDLVFLNSHIDRYERRELHGRPQQRSREPGWRRRASTCRARILRAR